MPLNIAPRFAQLGPNCRITSKSKFCHRVRCTLSIDGLLLKRYLRSLIALPLNILGLRLRLSTVVPSCSALCQVTCIDPLLREYLHYNQLQLHLPSSNKRNTTRLIEQICQKHELITTGTTTSRKAAYVRRTRTHPTTGRKFQTRNAGTNSVIPVNSPRQPLSSDRGLKRPDTAVHIGMEIKHVDISTAFLYEKYTVVKPLFVYDMTSLDETSSSSSRVCRIKTSTYGIRHAPRICEQGMHLHLTDHGYQQCPADMNIYNKS